MADVFGNEIEVTSPYQGDIERVTLDHEWTESELKDNVYDECVKLLEKISKKYVDRALLDRDMLKPQYLSEHIVSKYNVVDVYNQEYDKGRSTNEYGIRYFDRWIYKEVVTILDSNLVGKA